MKIDNDRTGFDSLGRPEGAQGAQAIAPSAVGRKDQSVSSDQVSVSAGAQLASSAMAAAEQASVLRQDKIERAKALLESGQLGSDPHRLADALIDRAISGD